jgi:predicted membrane protein
MATWRLKSSRDPHGTPHPSTVENMAAGIYGVIIGAAVMATSHGESSTAVALAVLVTLIVYWAAERYARLVAERVHDGRGLTLHEVRVQLTSGWTIVTASALPLAVLVAGDLLGFEAQVAVFLALAASTLLLFGVGWEIGREASLSTGERILMAMGAGAFGVVMVVLKALLH